MIEPLQTIHVSATGQDVRIRVNGGDMGVGWRQALELAQAVLRIGRVCRKYAAEQKKSPDPKRVTVEREKLGTINVIEIQAAGPALILEVNGKHWFACNYRQALPIAKAILTKARLLEEQAKANQIAGDHAILLRTPLGRLVGLSDNRKIQRLALKLSEDVKASARARLVEPQVVCGVPSLHVQPPV